jgi:hypothetical protein
MVDWPSLVRERRHRRWLIHPFELAIPLEIQKCIKSDPCTKCGPPRFRDRCIVGSRAPWSPHVQRRFSTNSVEMFARRRKSRHYLQNHHPVPAIVICEVKEKWTVTIDPARGSLLFTVAVGTRHLVHPTKCCASSCCDSCCRGSSRCQSEVNIGLCRSECSLKRKTDSVISISY